MSKLRGDTHYNTPEISLQADICSIYQNKNKINVSCFCPIYWLFYLLFFPSILDHLTLKIASQAPVNHYTHHFRCFAVRYYVT